MNASLLVNFARWKLEAYSGDCKRGREVKKHHRAARNDKSIFQSIDCSIRAQRCARIEQSFFLVVRPI
jgi:hypothetical protein